MCVKPEVMFIDRCVYNSQYTVTDVVAYICAVHLIG